MEEGEQGQGGILDAPRNADKAREECKTYRERQIGPGRDVRHKK